MRHRVAGKKLGRKTAHRIMMFRNMVTSLFDKERIRTTLPRAKAVRPIAERMITLGKKESLHARRQALTFVKDPEIVSKLFSTIAPRFAQRSGGYTRIIRLGFRDGDGAQMAILELIGSEFKPPKKEEGKGGKKAKKEEKPAAAAEEEKAPKKEETKEKGKGKRKKAPAAE
ncbi:MAG TPA: 50S ribosomal protein L17 [Acidobacteriota bacterium]|nr:50S ribosomal protein L17 [Acidobacteriota bacterium]